MADHTIDCTFAGFHVETAEFSVSQGVTPGSGTLTFADTTLSIPKTGTLIFSDDFNPNCQMNGMYAVNPRIEEDAASGRKLVVTIYDRRWTWKWSWVVMRTNTPDETGAPVQTMTLTALLQFLMTHLNESNYILTGIPAVYPEVNWEFENPATALQELLDKFGLSCGFDPSSNNGRITIAHKNYSRSMPSGDYESRSLSNSNDILPDEIILCGNRKIKQITFAALIPVGEDTDGTIVPIADLSYAPADWGKELIACFTNLSTLQERELAEKCVFKWYQINWSSYTRAAVLPLLNEVSEITTVDGLDQHDKPYILAAKTIWDGTEFKNISKARINDGYSIDKKTGIVKFTTQKVVAASEGAVAGDFSAPDMDLVAAYEEKAGGDETDFIYWSRAISGGTVALPVTFIDSSITGYYIDGALQNSAALGTYANNRLDELEAMYVSTLPEMRIYPGIWYGGAYGMIRMINLSVDASGGGVTEVQLGIEAPKADMNTFEETFLKQLTKQKLVMQADDKQTADIARNALGTKNVKRDEGENSDIQPLTWLGKTLKTMAKVSNVSGMVIPAKSVCVVTTYDATNKLWAINRRSSSTPANTPVVVVQEIIPSGDNGLAFWDGLHVVLKDSGYTPAVGDRVRPKEDSFEAEQNDAGALVVVKIDGSDLFVKPVGGGGGGGGIRTAVVAENATANNHIKCSFWDESTGAVATSGDDFEVEVYVHMLGSSRLDMVGEVLIIGTVVSVYQAVDYNGGSPVTRWYMIQTLTAGEEHWPYD